MSVVMKIVRPFYNGVGRHVHLSLFFVKEEGGWTRVNWEPVGCVEHSAVSFTNLSLNVQEYDINIIGSVHNNLWDPISILPLFPLMIPYRLAFITV